MNLFDELKNVYKITQETLARRSSLDCDAFCNYFFNLSHCQLYLVLMFVISLWYC